MLTFIYQWYIVILLDYILKGINYVNSNNINEKNIWNKKKLDKPR